MRVEQSGNGDKSTNAFQLLLNQLKEITGIHDAQILQRALNASQGDVGHAVGLLTTKPAEVHDAGEDPDSETQAWEAQKGGPKDELEVAIELSLQESHTIQEEERELTRALEASAEESGARVKRKRCEAPSEACSPTDWIRQEDWPVGIRNVGNTCWFSAVIQSLFHLPEFRRLVLNYCISERVLEKCKSNADKRNLAFMQELRCLFALMVGSTCKFVDPSASVELLRDAFRSSEAQQDVSEFTHKLLDWLEDAFQLTVFLRSEEDKKKNPMVQLFYGNFVTERKHEGKILSNIEQFGQYPLQVNGFNNLDECLEGAMVEREIESLHPDQTITSNRERWFSKLPPVLTFELSRFEFNAQLGRPEKIHKKLEFPQAAFSRLVAVSVVHILTLQILTCLPPIGSYKNYGSGPLKYPLADMLQFVLEFATTKPPSASQAEDPRNGGSPATPPPSDQPAESASEDGRYGRQRPFTQCRPPMECPPHPAPHDVSEEELHHVRACLQRWRSEVESSITGRTTQPPLVPYRLHAVLVHEGQASAGHYWAYIYDHANKRWMKYNDIAVTESSWEELMRDSYGGMTNASAYCLMYVDERISQLVAEDTDDETGQVLRGMDSLPPVLRRYVHADNCWFQQEISEWEEQFCQSQQVQQGQASQAGEPATAAASGPQEEETSPGSGPEAAQQTPVKRSHRDMEEDAPEGEVEGEGEEGVEPRRRQRRSQQASESEVSEVDIPNVGRITVRADADGYNEESMLTPAMQGVIMAIAKARQVFDADGPEAGLIKAFHEEYARLFELSQEDSTLQSDVRLHHALVYYFQNQAPGRIIERALLETFTDRNLSFDDRCWSLGLPCPCDFGFLSVSLYPPEDDYRQFRTVFIYLLTGLEQYQHGKVREALIYLAHAYQSNASLLKKGERRGVKQSVIALYRRKCLAALNESASQLFRSGEETEVEEGVAIMNEAIIPCLHLMSRDATLAPEDADVMETIRDHWCTCLSPDMDDSLQVKLGEILPRVLDSSAEMVVLKDPPKVHGSFPNDLCTRLAAAMESIRNTSIVVVK
uniref:Ubiquitin specific peptidase 28 n=1 Tax=Gadus morhua TaxID=8049 RepID=A0A8C5A8R0_GADMO